MSTDRSNPDRIFVELDAQIAAETEKLRVNTEQFQKRIVSLLLVRERLESALREAARAITETPNFASRQDAVTREAKPRASDLILEALKAEGSRGLRGADLKVLASRAGISEAAMDKARSRLKERDQIKFEGGLWLAVPESPSQQPSPAG